MSKPRAGHQGITHILHSMVTGFGPFNLPTRGLLRNWEGPLPLQGVRQRSRGVARLSQQRYYNMTQPEVFRWKPPLCICKCHLLHLYWAYIHEHVILFIKQLTVFSKLHLVCTVSNAVLCGFVTRSDSPGMLCGSSTSNHFITEIARWGEF